MALKDLKSDIEYIATHRAELLKEYRNKFVLLFDQKVVGSFDTYEVAAQEGVRQFGVNGNFLVQQILEAEPVNFIMEAIL